NGGRQPSIIKTRVRRHHWWGPQRTYGFNIAAFSGTQKSSGRASLTCDPIVPVWLQTILSKLYNILSPIAIPAVTVLLLLSIAYIFLRPPDIKEFATDAPAVAAGGTANLLWSADRASNVAIDPAPDQKPEGGQGQVAVTPTQTTEYTLTAKNWIGLSSTAKTTVGVVKVVAFTANPPQLTQE